MKCKNCGEQLNEKVIISIRNDIPVYRHENGEYFCLKGGVPRYACAQPTKTVRSD